MERRRLGRTGLQVGVLGFGAGAVGGLMTKGSPADQERAFARALELGINYIDTASIYGNGESEKTLGRIFKGRKRDDIYLGTKFRLKAADRRRVADFVTQSMDESLTRLGLDHVDLLQLHNPLVSVDADDRMDVDIALNEVVPALHKLQKAGKTRFIGFSGVGEPAALLKAVALTFVELSIVTAIALFFSTFSTPMLSAAFTFGFFIAGFSFLLMAVYLLYKLMGWEILWGNPTLVILISFLGGVQLISVGILGEYIGRIYEEVRSRPKFIVDRSAGFDSQPR